MVLLIFNGLCAQLWRVHIFSGIHLELKRFLRTKLGKDQKKRSSARTGVVIVSEIT